MMFAARKLQGLSVIVLLTIAAFFTYSISLPVSSTRSELQRVRAQVTQLRAENRMIEGDIAVLSTADQLEHWNGELFGYAPPGPAQSTSTSRLEVLVAVVKRDTITFHQQLAEAAGLLDAMLPLGTGDFIELPMSTNKYRVSATHKILVAQFMVGQDAGYGTSDPAMVLAVPSIQYRQEYLIYAQPFWKANWVDIIAPKAAKLTVDGAPIQNLIPIGTTDYGLAHVKLVNNADGNHTLKADLEFGIGVYGVLDYGSYWYPGGLDLSFVPPN